MTLKITLAFALLVVCAGPAAADDRPGAAVTGTVAAMNAQSHTDLAFGAAFGYKFNRVVGIEVEATLVPQMKSRALDDRFVIQAQDAASVQGALSAFGLIFPTPTFSNPDGRTVFFTNSVRVDVPTTWERIAPYFVAGGGVAHTRTVIEYTYPTFPVDLLPFGFGGLGVGDFARLSAGRPSVTQRLTTSATDLVLTLGGGVGIDLMPHVSLDADLRLFRLFGETDRNMGRFGVGVRYRF